MREVSESMINESVIGKLGVSESVIGKAAITRSVTCGLEPYLRRVDLRDYCRQLWLFEKIDTHTSKNYRNRFTYHALRTKQFHAQSIFWHSPCDKKTGGVR